MLFLYLCVRYRFCVYRNILFEEMFEKNKKYVLLGSCFSQYMGLRMQVEGYDAVCNPMGTLFNPESIRNTIVHALEGGAEDLPMFYDETMKEWRCWLANTRFRAPQESEARALVQEVFSSLGEDLRKAHRLFITLGTNVCYRLKTDSADDTEVHENGTIDSVDKHRECLVVSNCQRQPDRLFVEDTLSVDKLCNVLAQTIECLASYNTSLKITFTVSPYRYKKYGWHRSQLSKASLLLAIDEMQKRYPDRVDYFPSYEIMMDELRDYRYYAEDGLHPAPEAVDIIWNRLCEQTP